MNIVISPFHDYKKWENEGFRTRDAHLFQHFCKQNTGKILVINRPVTLVESLLKRKKWHIKTGTMIKKTFNYCLTKVDNDVYVLDILSFDNLGVIVYKKKWWDKVFRRKNTAKIIQICLKLLNMENDFVLLLQNPMAVGLNMYLNPSKFIFDGIDNWLEHPQMKDLHKNVEKNYRYIDETANVITSVSKTLLNVFSKNQNKYFIHNGVDLSYYKKGLSNGHFPIRTVGYVGKIQDRFDFELLCMLAKQHPNIEFRVAGPILSGKDWVKRIKREENNVLFLGNVNYECLPDFLGEVDICIMPHIVNSFSNSMNPLKVYEYLACGKVVVSTNVAGIEGISPYVFSASKKDFLALFDSIITKALPDAHDVVNSIPSEYYWENIANRFIALMEYNNEA